ncbi:hypothetical protein DESAMIL20_642 [Desulfurella amilsii]|uniref:Uncharacterized protein n=1 Tax=Desulfurella amilsii TaxID=1562698 RepID=A0A1X4XYB6_9BACT|nr:hypothetical protein [Desulfurella amilsii]OSS42527.1 hypothetical protein DESAMIL20_642 [Desulfurella amilsii]
MKSIFAWEIYEGEIILNEKKLDKFYENCKRIDGFHNVKLEMDNNRLTDIIVDEYDEFDGKSFAVEMAKVIKEGIIAFYFMGQESNGYEVSHMSVVPMYMDWSVDDEEEITIEEEV